MGTAHRRGPTSTAPTASGDVWTSAILPADESSESSMLQVIPRLEKAELPSDSPGLWVGQLLLLVRTWGLLPPSPISEVCKQVDRKHVAHFNSRFNLTKHRHPLTEATSLTHPYWSCTCCQHAQSLRLCISVVMYQQSETLPVLTTCSGGTNAECLDLMSTCLTVLEHTSSRVKPSGWSESWLARLMVLLSVPGTPSALRIGVIYFWLLKRINRIVFDDQLKII